MNRKPIVLTVVLTAALSASHGADAASYLKDCRVTFENDVLTVGNDRIRREFAWNDGDLRTTAIIDASTGEKLLMRELRSDVGLGKSAGKALSGQWAQTVVRDDLAAPHVQC